MSGTSARPNRDGSAQFHKGEADSAAAATDKTSDRSPPIYVRSTDFARLENLARIHAHPNDPAVRFLLSELDRAIVVRPDWLGNGIVRMHSRVIYRLNGQSRPESRILVYPHQFHPTGQYVSVFSSVGAALLGLREGTAMSFRIGDSGCNEVVIERVAYSPDHLGVE